MIWQKKKATRPEEDYAPVTRGMLGEPKYETLPRRSDTPASSYDPTTQYPSPRPTERDLQHSTTRVSRLGLPFELAPSRSMHGMVNRIQRDDEPDGEQEPEEELTTKATSSYVFKISNI